MLLLVSRLDDLVWRLLENRDARDRAAPVVGWRLEENSAISVIKLSNIAQWYDWLKRYTSGQCRRDVSCQISDLTNQLILCYQLFVKDRIIKD